MSSRLLRAMGVWATTAGCAAGLEAAGRVLPTPPIAHPGLLGTWFLSVGMPTAVFSGLRLALLAALVAWTGCLAVCAAACALGQGRRLAAWAACLHQPSVAAVMRLALGLTASSVVVSACGTGDGPPSPPVIRNLAAPVGNPAPLPGGGHMTPGGGGVGHEPPAPQHEKTGTAGGTTARRRTEGHRAARAKGPARPAPTPANRPDAGPAMAAPDARSRLPASGAAGPPTTPALDGTRARAGADEPEPGSAWSVRPGESFWSIAAAALASANGSVPPADEVARYWLALVDSNLLRLPPPHDPNLIYPGQEIRLPPLDGSAGTARP